jgi:uncharacterized membrane protein YeiH
MTYWALFYLALAGESSIASAGSARVRADWLGGVMLGLIVPLGGGSLRDLVLGQRPVFWVAHSSYLWTCVAGALLGIGLVRFIASHPRLILVVDTFGMVFFSAVGARKAHLLGFNVSVCLVSAVLTGSLGGVMRDVICNQVPKVFCREIYVIVSAATGLIYSALRLSTVGADVSLYAAVACGGAFRWVAWKRGWSLPIVGAQWTAWSKRIHQHHL